MFDVCERLVRLCTVVVHTVMDLPRVQTSLSCAQRKAGRRQRASAVCTLSMVPFGSSPDARLYLVENEAPEEEAGNR